MAKKFNITGNCHANIHYMADISKKLERTYAMVESGDYFIINRPRQYGKTTMLYTIAEHFAKKEDYIVFNISFEGIGDTVFLNETAFAPAFMRLLQNHEENLTKELLDWLISAEKRANDLESLSKIVTELIKITHKSIIVLIDEVDKSSNNQLFISFLAMLRNKFLERHRTKTFHSVVLAGVHDVKSLKLKLRPDEEQKYNSPWNIAAEYKVDMNLQVEEIKPMLADYCEERGVTMNIDEIAEKLFYYTSGYPFLVSKLCKMIDEDILPEKEVKEWTNHDLEITLKNIRLVNNPNFENVIKNLENNPELYAIVEQILMEAEYEDYNIYDPIINWGMIHGILKNGNGIRIHNRIYEELIYHYMTSRSKSKVLLRSFTTGKDFYTNDNGLNMEVVLNKFQAFMKEQYSKKDRDFLEKHGRLIFLAFIKPIINGAGYDFKEVQISEERRLDVVITYYEKKYIAEMKIWRGEKAHKEGIRQLVDYLDKNNQERGFLLIFDHSEVKEWTVKRIRTRGKKIYAVWV